MDRLVCISTGIVDTATANTDRAIEPGELAAMHMSSLRRMIQQYPSVLPPMVLKYVSARWRLILFPSKPSSGGP